MQHLFSAWQEVSRGIKAAKRVLLLCDYDGTLTPIVERPELAILPEKTRGFLFELAKQKGVTVGVISGRALSDLRQKVGIDGIIYAGNHGLEIEGPGISLVNPLAEEMRPVLQLIQQVLSKALSPIKGVFVENKGLTLTVHYRMVEEQKSAEVLNIFERVIATARSLGKVIVTTGKKVYEVRPPVDWDKGKAISLLIEKYGGTKAKSELLPIFLGDDQTDEDGFKATDKHGGIPILVGDKIQDSRAHYFLKSPDEAEEFLRMLLKFISKDRQ